MLLNSFLYLIIFLFGLTVGSFLNCIIYRLKENKGFFWGRSYCPLCKHKLSWQDLIPLLSFVLLKGKCRYCQKPISLQYPLVELGTGMLFLLIFNQFSIFNFQNLLATCYLLLTTCFLIIIFIYDLKHFIIPDEVIYPAIVIAFLYNLFHSFYILHTIYYILYSIFSALGASLFFLLIYLISQGKWLGFGDVKLAFFMGLFLGSPNILVALFLAFFIGALVGLGLIIAGKKTLKSEVPFGPFLVTGTFLAMFWAKEIINWYFNLFCL